ncbi:hypothetical protein F4808DRAFT_446878 [Astrocystis sublimbata]|nr:hypothetical protein F4808DRAFT_446878 [Astrocystis sublimbata]
MVLETATTSTTTMDGDVCAAPSPPIIDWTMPHHHHHHHADMDADSHSHTHMHTHVHRCSHRLTKSPRSPSSSPSFSSESESRTTLSRCSSLSSLTSAYSETDGSETDDCDDDNEVILISILKKPRPGRSPKPQQAHDQAQMSQQHQHSQGGADDASSHLHNQHHHHAIDGDEALGFNVDEETDDDDWQRCDDEEESECDIIFERNVSFDNPLATDLVTGLEVQPSTRSRVEWAAMKAREQLERIERKLMLLGVSDDNEEGEDEWNEEQAIEGGFQDKDTDTDTDIRGEDRHQVLNDEHGGKTEEKSGIEDDDARAARYPRESHSDQCVGQDHDVHDDIKAYVLEIEEAAVQSVAPLSVSAR